MNIDEFAKKEGISIRRAQKLLKYDPPLVISARKEIVNDRYVWVIDDDYIRLPGKKGPKRKGK